MRRKAAMAQRLTFSSAARVWAASPPFCVAAYAAIFSARVATTAACWFSSSMARLTDWSSRSVAVPLSARPMNLQIGPHLGRRRGQSRAGRGGRTARARSRGHGDHETHLVRPKEVQEAALSAIRPTVLPLQLASLGGDVVGHGVREEEGLLLLVVCPLQVADHELAVRVVVRPVGERLRERRRYVTPRGGRARQAQDRRCRTLRRPRVLGVGLARVVAVAVFLVLLDCAEAGQERVLGRLCLRLRSLRLRRLLALGLRLRRRH